MDLTQEENEFFEKEKKDYEEQISFHQKLKEQYMESEEYQKAKKENTKIEQLKKSIQGLESSKLKIIQKKERAKLNNNYDEIIKETKNKYETKIKNAEESYQKGLKEMSEKYNNELKNIDKKYILEKKHSPEYNAMLIEEKRLLKNDRFDEAIALQKLRKKKEEEDNKRYLMIHNKEIETLKRNLTNKHNKEVNNFQKNKMNEIDLIKKEMNIALDNIDKQFNNRRHELISIQNNESLINKNVSLAKSRIIYKKTYTTNDMPNAKRIFGPLSIHNSINKNKIYTIKRSSNGKRIKSAKNEQ